MPLDSAVIGEVPHRYVSVAYSDPSLAGSIKRLAVLDCSETSHLIGLNNTFYVNRIIVPESMRNRGVGTQMMERLVDIADASSFTLHIDPTDNYGSDVVRLARFFARFGFVTSLDSDRPFGRMVRKV